MTCRTLVLSSNFVFVLLYNRCGKRCERAAFLRLLPRSPSWLEKHRGGLRRLLELPIRTALPGKCAETHIYSPRQTRRCISTCWIDGCTGWADASISSDVCLWSIALCLSPRGAVLMTEISILECDMCEVIVSLFLYVRSIRLARTLPLDTSQAERLESRNDEEENKK